MTGGSTAEQIQLALADVWDRSYSVVLERAGVIEEATIELSKQHPEVELIDAGRAEAHKLAGVLGTFGLDRGTELARALERRLNVQGSEDEADEAGRLLAELRSAIDAAHR